MAAVMVRGHGILLNAMLSFENLKVSAIGLL